MDDLIAQLKDVLGPNGALEGADIGEAYREDFGRFRNTAPRLVMRPASTEQVSRVMALCNKAAAACHGMKLAFSTGSQNHQPPQPSS